jgi:hypothetical protein
MNIPRIRANWFMYGDEKYAGRDKKVRPLSLFQTDIPVREGAFDLDLMQLMHYAR